MALRYRVYKISKGDDESNLDYAEWPDDYGAPLDKNGLPMVLGDQTLWTVYNAMDTSITHNWWWESLAPIPLEIQQIAFSRGGNHYDATDIFSNVVFKEWLIINKGNKLIDSAYFSFWSDIDFDDWTDNKPAINTVRQLCYCWTERTATRNDSIPPAVGYVMLYGPVIPEQGSSATFKGKVVQDYKNLSLTALRGIADDSIIYDSLYGPIHSVNEAQNVARGLTSNGLPIINPVTGLATPFPFSGDPVTGEGWVYNHWTSGGAGLIFISGPFTLAPKDTQWVMIAVVPGLGSSNLNSITQMRRKAEILRSLPYDSLAFGTTSYSITDVEEIHSEDIPTTFYLSQNYPNPFNPTTTIQYSVPSVGAYRNTPVQLKVYDVLGNEIAILVNEEKPPGTYEVEFSTGLIHQTIENTLPSGIYFYQLRAGDFIETNKMVLLK
jgi:hypothetical protein